MNQTYYIETYGCQMNEYDSLIARQILENGKMTRVLSPDEADLILLNTCSVRENAHQKVFNRLKSLEYLQKKGAKIGVLGCMAQALGNTLFEKKLPIDIIVGPDSLKNLINSNAKEASYIGVSKTETYEDIIPAIDHHLGIHKDSLSAYVAIQRGCNKFCSFCVVPFTRGRERSRSPQSIIEEINALTDCGMRTITLLGQNVNSYNHEKTTFVDLVKAVLNETGVKRLYYTSPYPKDFPAELIELTAADKRIGTMVHLPLQSGNDEILEKMKREYNVKEYLSIVSDFRNAIDDIAITTDVIVGFPGETEAQYEDTLEVMEKADFDSAFMFSYSERPWTFASKHYADDISEEVKSRRLAKLIEEQQNRSYNKNQKYVDTFVTVMVEGLSKRSDMEFVGTMRNGKKAIAPIPEGVSLISMLGQDIQIQIKKANSYSMWGKASS